MNQQGKVYTHAERTTIIEQIADRLMDGESLRKICQSDDMPPKTTVLRWLNDQDDRELVTIIARAREMQADALDDQMQDIINRMLAGELGHNEARVAIWSAQWRASKMKPRRYGEKLLNEHSGRDGRPIQIITAQTDPESAARIYREMFE